MTESEYTADSDVSRALNTVYTVDYNTKIKLKKGSLIVSSPDKSQRIPLEAVNSIVIYAGHITIDAIAECVRRKIRVSALAKNGKIRFTAGGPVSGNVHLRSAHHASANDEAIATSAARHIVAVKVRNSAVVLRRWARDHPDPDTVIQLHDRSDQVLKRIDWIASAENRDILRGIEGDTARIYFGGLAVALGKNGLEFNGRTRRPPRDPVNCAMSFCYGLIVTEMVGACDAIGLDPQVGFLHQALRSGRPSLALDMAEELRALTDRFVVTSVKRDQITLDHFRETPGGAFYFNDDGLRNILRLWEVHKSTWLHHELLGRPIQRWTIPTAQATLMARWLRSDLLDYPPFLLKD